VAIHHDFEAPKILECAGTHRVEPGVHSPAFTAGFA
jgi:hypothetical protein